MLPISVPGCVDAWAELHKKFGKLSLGDDLAPAIRYAEEGFPVTELIAFIGLSVRELYKDLPGGFLETYTLDGKGRTPAKGDIFKNPALAKTLRLIGEKGRDAFYKGEIADKIDAFMQANGGYLRKADFEKHTSDLGRSGFDELSRLRCLRIAAERPGHRHAPDPEHSRRIRSAKRWVAIRRKHCTPWSKRRRSRGRIARNSMPIRRSRKFRSKGLLSKAYAAERRKLIDPKHAAKTVAPGNPALEQGDTIYMCAADDEGNMVSLIQSNYRGMGSGIVVPGLGFMFQDRGELFSMEPGHANVYAPGKRPFHTIIPGFVMKDGKPWEAFGVMGGGMQPQGHVQVLTNQIDFGLDVQEAGDASRWQHEGDNEPTGEKMTRTAVT